MRIYSFCSTCRSVPQYCRSSTAAVRQKGICRTCRTVPHYTPPLGGVDSDGVLRQMRFQCGNGEGSKREVFAALDFGEKKSWSIAQKAGMR
jgi:hypothetical protein